MNGAARCTKVGPGRRPELTSVFPLIHDAPSADRNRESPENEQTPYGTGTPNKHQLLARHGYTQKHVQSPQCAPGPGMVKMGVHEGAQSAGHITEGASYLLLVLPIRLCPLTVLRASFLQLVKQSQQTSGTNTSSNAIEYSTAQASTPLLVMLDNT